MKTDLVFKHAYEGYNHSLNGESKNAVRSFTQMYKEAKNNPTQARFLMDSAHKKANNDYDATTKNSEWKTMFNVFKTFLRTTYSYITNKEFRQADNDFMKSYKKTYPKTHLLRDIIMEEKNLP